MENFISDTEINIKQKMMCRICFLYRFGGKAWFWGVSISSVMAAGGFALRRIIWKNVKPPPVGASPLAMVGNDDAGCLNARVVPAFFASRLAPAEKLMGVHQKQKKPRKSGAIRGAAVMLQEVMLSDVYPIRGMPCLQIA
jgi:hypothetical protein